MIVLVTDRWDPAGGGRERYLADLATYLSGRGEVVRVFASEVRDSGGAGVSRVSGVAAVPHLRWLGRGVAELSLQREFRRLLVGEQGPILAARPADGATHVQLHSGLLADAFEAEREALDGVRRALYRTAGAMNAKRRLLLAAEARTLGAAPPPRVMVFSRALAHALARRHGVPAASITVATPGIDETAFRPPESLEPPREPVFLFAGHNFLLKGLAQALEALALARRTVPSARLRVVGGGRRGPFERRALALGLAGAVEFLGAQPRGALAALYRSSTALVHPTFFDPYALVCVEALASGCPVVTTARNGASETIVAGRHGFVITDPRDTGALAKTLLEVAEPRTNRAMREATAALAPQLGFTSHAERVHAWLTRSDADEPDPASAPPDLDRSR